MVWIALGVGAVLAGVVARLAGRYRRRAPDLAAGALVAAGAAGMFALAALSVVEGSPAAAAPATIVAVALILDWSEVRGAVAARLHRAHGSTVTPFQNAT